MSVEPRTWWERTWWDWHRLSDNWARRLVERAHIRPGELVLDVGAGTGAITRHLSADARAIAIEARPQPIVGCGRSISR